MILKGNQRAGGKQLAAHLLNATDNEHVHVHETRGFMADDLPSAFHEAYAVSRGTKATQFLFSLSLNPPREEKVPTEAFIDAIDRIETKLGLDNQPRAIVFHEKEGRRHAHAVWSRIDAAEMKAINLPHYKLKLREVSRELYFEHGWQMPRGMVDSQERNPANFTHAEWQQAKRGGHDPKALKSMFQECWAISDTGAAFAQALKARGYTLAQGDRRGHVAVDFQGEVYAISKFVDRKAKEVRDKLGDADRLVTVDEAKQEIASRMTDMLKRHIAEMRAKQRTEAAALVLRRAEMVQRQREERARLETKQSERWAREVQDRARRRTTGLRGIWDFIVGRQAKVDRENQFFALQALRRDRAEKDEMIFAHIDQRQALHHHSRQMRWEHAEQVAALHRDIAAFDRMDDPAQAAGKDAIQARFVSQRTPRGQRGKTLDRDR